LNPLLDLDTMRASGRILAQVLETACAEWIRVGITPAEISERADQAIRSHQGAVPAFFGYNGFPAAACISVNDEILHGIPSQRKLQDGDIVRLDCGVALDGHYTDACRSVVLDPVPQRLRLLLKVTREALDKGIEAARVGNHIGDISYAIQRHVERKGFKASSDFTGHGIGHKLHMAPSIPNCGPPGQGELITEGVCFAIEPVIFDGPMGARLRSDKWTIFSPTQTPSAHFEDTVIVTLFGPEVITR